MGLSASAKEKRDIYSVSRLNRAVSRLLQDNLPLLWVEGELSNLRKYPSGHWYFTLKDAQAQISCVMFRGRNQHVGFDPEDGMQLLLRARVGLYEARGNYQLVAEHMEAAGDGALRRAFDELKQKLAEEGLFDEDHKQDIPTLPQGIAVITSPTGAAVRDIISVLGRRFPSIPVVVYPVAVQGEGAGAQIAAAIKLANKRKESDVIIVARGGGSLEDLWAFNEEVVARAIYKSKLPIVSGVGHEIDFTIADFVADQRAPTPSVAAEMVSPDQDEWLAELEGYEARLENLMDQLLLGQQQKCLWLSKRLQQQHPGTLMRQRSQRLDDLELRFRLALNSTLRHTQSGFGELVARLHRHIPQHRILQLQAQCKSAAQRLNTTIQHTMENQQQKLALATRALDTISPLATLGRGYAIVSTSPGGKMGSKILRDAAELNPGDRIEARLARGSLLCTVDKTREETP